jgi:carboxyl-terminal processing protease
LSRAIFLVLLCTFLPGALGWQAVAEPVFGAAGAASVWAAALAYIAPRVVQVGSIPQMSIWGLHGLTALDPDLDPALQSGQIRLYDADRLLGAVSAPSPQDAKAWALAAARLAAAGYAASGALQQAGTQGVISSFFDELFNHFDPYSRYEPPLQAAQDELMITGAAGCGLTLARQGGAVVIASVAPDSPAAEAGLVPGLKVLSIDGRTAYPSALATLNANLNGIPGSKLKLRLLDPVSGTGPDEIVLVRDFVPPQTVSAATYPAMGRPHFLTLKISAFNRGTSDQFSAALVAALDANPPSGLVIDLRGNRGGVLRQAVLLADSLMSSGVIVVTSGRDPDADQRFVAEGSDLTRGLPIVVLVDGQTASAAEILGAALADNRRAVVVGSATLGKGLVQAVTTLPDGGKLFVTWSRVLGPRGWPLQTLGLLPQVCTSLGPEQLTAQLNGLARGENLMKQPLAEARAIRPPASIERILAIRAACPAAIGGDIDLSAAQSLLADPAAYRAALLPPLPSR